MLSQDDHVPLVDKALESLYPSGSTSSRRWRCAAQRGDRPQRTRLLLRLLPGRKPRIPLRPASWGGQHDRRPLSIACDIYFYDMCRRVGADKLAPMIRSVGFGEKFDLPFENQRYGTVPDPQWLERKYHREWQIYDTSTCRSARATS